MYHVRKLDNFDVHHRLSFKCISRSPLIRGEPGFGKRATPLNSCEVYLTERGQSKFTLTPSRSQESTHLIYRVNTVLVTL
jgi:hypothetical protein